MKPVFVQIKCELGRTFDVAEAILETIEETSEVYSTSGGFDLLAKFYLDDETSIGRFVNERVQRVAGIRDTYTLTAYRIFGREQPDGIAAG